MQLIMTKPCVKNETQKFIYKCALDAEYYLLKDKILASVVKRTNNEIY